MDRHSSPTVTGHPLDRHGPDRRAVLVRPAGWAREDGAAWSRPMSPRAVLAGREATRCDQGAD